MNMEEALRISQANSQKLDRITQLLEGDGADAPGLVGRIGTMENVLFGKNKRGGIVGQHDIMWRIHVWLLCGLSGAGGYLLKAYFHT